jgi:hypothetical protein
MPTHILLRTSGDAAPLPPQTATKRSRSGRAVFLTWLRKIHLYVGLWGAVLGLLFGATGILMNHRAILRIPVEKTAQKSAQLAVPERGFAAPDDLAAWLQQELKFTSTQTPQVRSQPAKKLMWGDREVLQPERWSVSLARPEQGYLAEYYVGNRFVKIDRLDATPLGTLMRLHTATGVSAFWVLLADSIAGSFILLSLTGLLLWTQLHTVRTIAVLTCSGALLAAAWFMWSI